MSLVAELVFSRGSTAPFQHLGVSLVDFNFVP